MGEEERNPRAARVSRIPRLLRAGGRPDQPGRRSARGRRPAHDRARSQGPRVPLRVHPAYEPGRLPGAPPAPRPGVPAALMKEELPRGDFHIQEERRLFYVALTRARDRLTLTTIANSNKNSKPSVFLEDILMDPETK